MTDTTVSEIGLLTTMGESAYLYSILLAVHSPELTSIVFDVLY